MKKRTPFCVFRDRPATLCVEAKYSGIHPLVFAIDGLPMLVENGRRGKSKMYFDVQVVIDWHRKELAATKGVSGNAKILAALETALAKFKAGNVIDNA